MAHSQCLEYGGTLIIIKWVNVICKCAHWSAKAECVFCQKRKRFELISVSYKQLTIFADWTWTMTCAHFSVLKPLIWFPWVQRLLQGPTTTQELKVIDRLCATHSTPADYRQTDNYNRLVMNIRIYHWLNSANRVLISTCSAPLVKTGECKQFSLFDLDLRPWSTILD